MQTMCLDVFPNMFNYKINKHSLQNISKKKILEILKKRDIGSWIFRFDYITSKYYLTIKNNENEYIDHEVCYYCKRTDEVLIQEPSKKVCMYLSLDNYLNEMKKIYNFDLSKEISV